MKLHRNSQKRFYNKNYIYFITVNTQKRFPYFKEKIFCDLFIAELKLCQKLKNFKLYAFGLNYDHFHLLVKPTENENISKIMQFLKRHSSRNINFILNENGDESQSRKMVPENESDIRQCRFRFQEPFFFEIKKHDDYIKKIKHQFKQKYGLNQNEFPKFQWQKSFHDHIIRNKNDFKNHYFYTVYNFIKHELPKDWKFTSLYR